MYRILFPKNILLVRNYISLVPSYATHQFPQYSKTGHDVAKFYELSDESMITAQMIELSSESNRKYPYQKN